MTGLAHDAALTASTDGASGGRASRRRSHRAAVATHRPALVRRRFRHDKPIALDLFSGYGGFTDGIEEAGFEVIMAANHNRHKVEVHEANHPNTEHWIADLVDTEAADYHSARDLPAADLLVAGVSCVNHSRANSQKAYARQAELYELEDPEFEARVTRSEKDRATANCVLHYADTHHPRLILVECTTELQSWGPALASNPRIGDGTTFQWWLRQFANLGYRHKILYLNSMFFGVPQSRDRLYIAFWDKGLAAPDLEHRPPSWCSSCDDTVEAVWTWRTHVPPSGSVCYGKQYDYRCPRCRARVYPPATPSIVALDLTDLGMRIGDKPLRQFKDKKTGEVTTGPMAPATMARADRCRRRFADFPAVLMPAKSVRGVERHPWQPMATQTSQQEAALLSTGVLIGAAGNTYERPGSDCRSRGLTAPLWTQSATNATALLTPPVALAVDNYQGIPRGPHEALPTQTGSETLAVVSSGVMPYRKNTVPTVHAEPMPTVTADQFPAMISAAGLIKNNGSIDEAKYRPYPLDEALGTLTSSPTQAMLFGGWIKHNGSHGDETAPHPLSDPFGSFPARINTSLLTAEWRAALADLALNDCFFRMMAAHEIGRGCGFDVDFPGYKGEFIVWGAARDQVDGFGNAVSPPVGMFLGSQLRAVLHSEVAA